MSIITTLFTSWRRVLSVFFPDDRPRLLESLCEAYRAEVRAMAQYPQHARQMYYPHFRERLLWMAADAQAQLPWLQAQIFLLGGTLPQCGAPLKTGNNSWESLRLDLAEAQHVRSNLLTWIHTAQPDPEIAAGLRRLRQDKLKQQEELRDMLMKSDPYTPPTGTLHTQDALQKHAWLAQRKREWLDHERAAWEARGRQELWAEWVGEQECRWATELPHRDLEWARHLAEQEAGETNSAGGSVALARAP